MMQLNVPDSLPLVKNEQGIKVWIVRNPGTDEPTFGVYFSPVRAIQYIRDWLVAAGQTPDEGPDDCGEGIWEFSGYRIEPDVLRH